MSQINFIIIAQYTIVKQKIAYCAINFIYFTYFLRKGGTEMQLKDIQSRLRECIAWSGISQRELAERIGVSPQTVSKYMKKDVFPALDTFARICNVIEVSSDYVLGLKDY